MAHHLGQPPPHHHHASSPSITMSRLPPPPQVTNISPREYLETMINNIVVIRTDPPQLRPSPGVTAPQSTPIVLPLLTVDRGMRRETYVRRPREELEGGVGHNNNNNNNNNSEYHPSLYSIWDRLMNKGGLSEETIGRCLKKRKPCPDQDKEADHTDTDNKVCSVCLEDLVVESSSSSDIKEVDEDMIVGVLDCRHEFHVRCIKQWLRKKNACPLCRATALRR
ncbi:hypothetical protein OROGR_004568 [Orobanche gracilis]